MSLEARIDRLEGLLEGAILVLPDRVSSLERRVDLRSSGEIQALGTGN